MIPRGEMQYWRRAVDGISEPALGTDTLAGVPEQHPANVDLHERLVLQAREMQASCPDLWECLDVMTRVSPHDAVLMSPSTAMSFGERMAYRTGQDSIGQWLRALADTDLERESGDGEA